MASDDLSTSRTFQNWIEQSRGEQTWGSRALGWIEVITGSMFSGKTEELMRRLRRANIARLECLLVKARMDTRYSETDVVSHDQNRLESIAIDSSDELWDLAEAFHVVGIDEAQFFDEGLVEVCERLAAAGKRVIVAGLDQDFRSLPFGPIPRLMTLAEFVTKQCAICVQCGRPATKNQRLVPSLDQVMLGAEETYEARCRHCYEAPRAPI